MKRNGFESEFKDLLEDTLRETGLQLTEQIDTLAVYAAERAEHLANISGEPGFAQAVTAERDALAIRAGIAAVDVASSTEQRLLGVIAGALRIGAAALAAI